MIKVLASCAWPVALPWRRSGSDRWILGSEVGRVWQGWGLRVYLFHPYDHHITVLPGLSALLKSQESP